MKGNIITQVVIGAMLGDQTIPKDGCFEVTQHLLDLYYDKFKKLYPELSVSKYHRKPSNVRYYKKLAGLTLLKMSISRIPVLSKKEKTPRLKCGILYLISNPAFPGMYKIGITQDLGARLSQYQTYDPYRNFKVEHYKFVDDMRKTEKDILSEFRVNISEGEWIDNSKVKEIFTEFT